MAQRRAGSTAAAAQLPLRIARVAPHRAAQAGAEGLALVSHFRARGHLEAQLDPLRRCRGALTHRWPPSPAAWAPIGSVDPDGLQPTDAPAPPPACPRRRGHSRRVFVGRTLPHAGSSTWLSRGELLRRLREAYCGPMGFEAAHLTCPRQRQWWWRAAELPRARWHLAPAGQRALLERLLHSTLFEEFLGAKYPSSKRFGLDGCEALVPGLLHLCQRSGRHGVDFVELGMSHRGRLNVLSNLLGKPMGQICVEMKENPSDFHVGDVKYHLGVTGTLCQNVDDEHVGPLVLGREADETNGCRSPVQLRIEHNPSHLEAVGPVVLGRVRSQQDRLGGGPEARRRVMPVLIHGDAAFAGLGVVVETFQLAQLPGYATGGCVHVVLNNQIGFTTEPFEARSSAHPSDTVLGLGVPVVHVNADDVEAVVRAFALAADWRAEFGRDVVVDLVGYRRFGHNELDVPEVTQPRSCELMKNHPTAVALYEDRLVEASVCVREVVAAMRKRILEQWEAEFADSGRYRQGGLEWLRDIYGGRQDQLFSRDDLGLNWVTGVPLSTLRKIAEVCCQPPNGFTPHPRVVQHLEKRLKAVIGHGRVDFATAEMLAFGCILLHKDVTWPSEHGGDTCARSPDDHMGVAVVLPERNVRLSGQDSRRGTFNQRHASMIDVNTCQEWMPLSVMMPGKQARFAAHNSPLSEMAVLAFEYGYSVGDPETLVMWEAQFGDFANNAQVIIDQFIASAEEKWGQTSSLTLLLPHGYDGQGPDHSSARLERFLVLVNDDPDQLPGASLEEEREYDRAFDVLSNAVNDGPVLITKKVLTSYLSSLGAFSAESEFQTIDEVWAEMGAGHDIDVGICRQRWKTFMKRWYRRRSEQRANIFVVNVSTPAQYFHVLRRQAHRRYKKPLVVMAPKFLLHHSKATSALGDMGPGTFFRRVIVDYSPLGPQEQCMGDNTRHLAVTKSGASLSEPPEDVRRLLICSGQIYYHLSNARKARKIKDVAILRLEQIAPFPHDLITQTILFYPNADVVWCQEEPKNFGAWFYVRPRLATALRELEKEGGRRVQVQYVGRPVAAATATGSQHIHLRETRHILDEALVIPPVAESIVPSNSA